MAKNIWWKMAIFGSSGRSTDFSSQFFGRASVLVLKSSPTFHLSNRHQIRFGPKMHLGKKKINIFIIKKYMAFCTFVTYIIILLYVGPLIWFVFLSLNGFFSSSVSWKVIRVHLSISYYLQSTWNKYSNKKYSIHE